MKLATKIEIKECEINYPLIEESRFECRQAKEANNSTYYRRILEKTKDQDQVSRTQDIDFRSKNSSIFNRFLKSFIQV